MTKKDDGLYDIKHHFGVFRTAYGPHPDPQLICPEATLTQQSFEDECDINKIMEKAKRGQVVDHINRYTPVYEDVTGFDSDYQSALNLVQQAQETFDELPALVRDRFANDPARYMGFMADLPANRDEAIKLGLIIPHATFDEPASGDAGGAVSEPGRRPGSQASERPRAASPGAPKPRLEGNLPETSER